MAQTCLRFRVSSLRVQLHVLEDVARQNVADLQVLSVAQIDVLRYVLLLKRQINAEEILTKEDVRMSFFELTSANSEPVGGSQAKQKNTQQK